MPILQIDQLTKRYGKITAVQNLNLEVQKGSIFGILGPNGSGKTTTLGMLLDIIHPDSGAFSWFEGRYGKQARLHIGSLLETPNFYPYLSAVENLQIIAHIKRAAHPRIDALLELVNLQHRKFSKFRTYSLGMKQRLAIAAALIGNPEVLIFDEPTNGLDPKGIAEVRETILQIAQTGKTILMASHILDEVEKICSHVAIIRDGQLLATGTVGAILSDEKTIEVGAKDLESLQRLLSNIPEITKLEQTNGRFLLSVPPDFDAQQLNQLAFDRGLVLNHLAARAKSLEAEFLEITAR